uniref:Glutathione peroxidase n=1 Tax=Monodelphis domestica TaxID=13616 RepID=A0A5F8G606_MONDO
MPQAVSEGKRAGVGEVPGAHNQAFQVGKVVASLIKQRSSQTRRAPGRRCSRPFPALGFSFRRRHGRGNPPGLLASPARPGRLRPAHLGPGEDEELNALQEDMKSSGLVILGFPCNQFGKQEPGQNSEILSALKYVRPGGGFVPNFQLFEKGDVNGEKEQKFYTFLKNSCPPPSELIGTSSRLFWEPMRVHDIRWNFEKFLVGPDGIPIMRWYHRATVSTVKADILEYLQKHSSLDMSA